MADHFSESMPIVPEKLFTSALVTHTQSVTHTHIHRLLSSTSLLYTHTHIHTHGSPQLSGWQGTSRDYVVSLTLSMSLRVLSVSFRVRQEDWSHGKNTTTSSPDRRPDQLQLSFGDPAGGDQL